VATIAGYYLLPESPRWLVEVDKEAEALKIVNSWILRNGHDIKIASLSDDSHHEELGCSALWARRKLRYVFIVMGVVWFCVGMSYYGIVLLLPRVFEHGASEAADVQVGDVCSRGLAFDFKDLGVAVASEVVGVFLATLVIDKPGRTWTQFIFYAVAGACSFVLAFTNLDKNVLLVAGTLARLSCMAAFCATYVHTPELFPTRVRGTAHTSVNLSSRVGAFLAPWMISDLVPQFREDVLTGLLAMSVVAILAGVCAMLLPETSGKEMTDAEYDATDDEDEDDDDEEGSEDPLGPTAE
jgi:putative MFS transporter